MGTGAAPLPKTSAASAKRRNGLVIQRTTSTEASTMPTAMALSEAKEAWGDASARCSAGGAAKAIQLPSSRRMPPPMRRSGPEPT